MMARLGLSPLLSAVCVVTAASALAATLPRIEVILAVRFSPDNVSAIDVTLHIDDARSRAGRSLLELDLNHGLTPTLRYDGDALSASDALGQLSLTYTDTNASDAQRTWTPQRDPQGQITVQIRAVPRVTNASTPSGPRIDLRPDQGGAIGMGTGFLPLPPADEDWSITVRWEVAAGCSAPPGTRFASSLGDGPNTTAIGRPSTVLAKSYFAVGQLQRWPSWDVAAPTPGQREFYVYWIGTLPYDTDRICTTAREMHLAIATFFADTTTPFRIFWRRVPAGYGGAGGFDSFILEYAAGTAAEQSAEAAAFLLSHETIHEYALMAPARQYDLWYREGVAQYYAVVAPYLGGAVDKAYLRRWLNNNAQAYYTGGTANMTWQGILDGYWTGVQVVKAPYGVGFVYLVQVQGLVRRATNGTKGLDDVVLELYRRYVAREKVQTAEFVDVLGELAGRDVAEASLAAMMNGSLVVPPADALAHFGLRMVRRDAEPFDLGYVAAKGRVVGFTAERSRAQEAGLQIGDEIVSSWGAWGAGDSLDNMMQVVVRRNESEFTVRYWPRSYDKVENWMWVDDGSGAS